METFYFNAVTRYSVETILEKKKTVINGTRTGGCSRHWNDYYSHMVTHCIIIWGNLWWIPTIPTYIKCVCSYRTGLWTVSVVQIWVTLSHCRSYYYYLLLPCTLLDSERTETAVWTLPAGRRTARAAAVATRRLQQRLSVGRQGGEQHSREPSPRRQQHRRRPKCRVAAMALSRRPRLLSYYTIFNTKIWRDEPQRLVIYLNK
jgi:hypothetical protein